MEILLILKKNGKSLKRRILEFVILFAIIFVGCFFIINIIYPSVFEYKLLLSIELGLSITSIPELIFYGKAKEKRRKIGSYLMISGIIILNLCFIIFPFVVTLYLTLLLVIGLILILIAILFGFV